MHEVEVYHVTLVVGRGCVRWNSGGEKCGEEDVEGDVCCVGSMMGSGEAIFIAEGKVKVEDDMENMKVLLMVELRFKVSNERRSLNDVMIRE